MKKRKRFILILFSFSLFLTGQIFAEVLWDFEEAEVGKKVKGWITGQGGKLLGSEENPYEGKRCAVLIHPQGFKYNTWIRSPWIKVEPQEKYTFLLYYRNPQGIFCGAQLRFFEDKSKKKWVNLNYLFTDKGEKFEEWKKRVRIMKIPDNAHYVRIYLYASSPKGGKVFFDDIAVGKESEIHKLLHSSNLALQGKARCWDKNSGIINLEWVPRREFKKEYSPSRVNDGEDRTYWTSNVPTQAPPKDIGIEWEKPVTISSVVVKYVNEDFQPPTQGEELQYQKGEEGVWEKLEAEVTEDRGRCIRIYNFNPTQVRRVRLYITEFPKVRPSIKEIEVYPTRKVPKDISNTFDYTYPPREKPTEGKPIFITWYNPTPITFLSSEPDLRLLGTSELLNKKLSPLYKRKLLVSFFKKLKEAGFGGLLARAGRIDSSPEEIRYQALKNFSETGLSLKEHLEIAQSLGIKNNFWLFGQFAEGWEVGKVPEKIKKKFKLVKIRYQDKEKMVIDWFDDDSWRKILSTIREQAKMAKEIGAVGVAYDIEPYSATYGFYQSKCYPYKEEKKKEFLEIVERRGREIAKAIISEFPEAEIIWLAGYTQKNFDLHTALFKGLTSVESGGVYIFTERTYISSHSERIKSAYQKTLKFGRENSGNVEFWKRKCGVAPGTMPIWKGRGIQVTPKEVVRQLRAFASLNPKPKYIWLYPGWNPFLDPEYGAYRWAFRNY